MQGEVARLWARGNEARAARLGRRNERRRPARALRNASARKEKGGEGSRACVRIRRRSENEDRRDERRVEELAGVDGHRSRYGREQWRLRDKQCTILTQFDSTLTCWNSKFHI